MDKADELWFAAQDAANEALSVREDYDVPLSYVAAAERVMEDTEGDYDRYMGHTGFGDWLNTL